LLLKAWTIHDGEIHKMNDEGIPSLFSSGWLEGDRLVVPAGPAEAIFDLAQRKVSGPGRDGLPVEFSLDGAQLHLQHAVTQEGQSEQHLYTLKLSNAGQEIWLSERVRLYQQADENMQQEVQKTLAAIHAVPALLAIGGQIDRPELVPTEPKAAFSKKASATFQSTRRPVEKTPWQAVGVACVALGICLWWLWRRK
jgi:hypothetical protein